MKVIQTTKIPERKNIIAITSIDETHNYAGRIAIIEVKSMMLWEALEIAHRMLSEHDYPVVIDDINKFSLASSCHMERGATMKAFLTRASFLHGHLVLRTDEILPSLNEMIKKIFQ